MKITWDKQCHLTVVLFTCACSVLFHFHVQNPDRSLVISLTRHRYTCTCILAKVNPEIWYGSLPLCLSFWRLETGNPDQSTTGPDMARACCTVRVRKQLFEIVAINVKQLEDS